jgi:hypothetical protein
LDPEVRGITCLEEPENGIHPTRIPAIVQLLRDISVDPDSPVDQDNPLRQVVINTHSPEVFQNCDPRSELVFLDEVSIDVDEQQGRVAAVRAPKPSWRVELGDGTPALARGSMGAYLGQAAPREQRQKWLNLWSRGP